MKELIKKIASAKKEIGSISKESTNPFFKSKYFDINQLLEHVEVILSMNGLMVLQPIKDNKVTSIIFDIDSGESIESAIELPTLTDPQKLGSAITYYRRYTLQSLLSLQAEDDDANAASKATQTTTSNDDSPEEWLNIHPSKTSKAITLNFIKAWETIHLNGGNISDVRKDYKVSKPVAVSLNDGKIVKILSEENYNLTLDSTLDKITNVLNQFAMKKVQREDLEKIVSDAKTDHVMNLEESGLTLEDVQHEQ